MARLTIPDEQTFATFTVTTSTSAFPITFSLFAKADLTVLVAGAALDQSAFTFTGTLLEGGGYDGGTVTLNTAVDDVTVRIERNVAPARASNFAPANNVPVGSVDQALNRLTANAQDLKRRLDETGPEQAAASAAVASAQAAIATASAAAAVTAETNAETAETNAAASQSAASASAGAAAASATTAGLSALASDYYPAATSHVPRGIMSTSGLTAGSGGTNGTFALTYSGGNFTVNPTGTFTVSGGALTAVTITGPGLYIGASPTAPTATFTNSAGLTGAAVTLVADFRITSGNGYWTDHASDTTKIQHFRNVSGTATISTGVTLQRSEDPYRPTVWLEYVSGTANAMIVRPLSSRQVLLSPFSQYRFKMQFPFDVTTGSVAAELQQYDSTPTGVNQAIKATDGTSALAVGSIRQYEIIEFQRNPDPVGSNPGLANEFRLLPPRETAQKVVTEELQTLTLQSPSPSYIGSVHRVAERVYVVKHKSVQYDAAYSARAIDQDVVQTVMYNMGRAQSQSASVAVNVMSSNSDRAFIDGKWYEYSQFLSNEGTGGVFDREQPSVAEAEPRVGPLADAVATYVQIGVGKGYLINVAADFTITVDGGATDYSTMAVGSIVNFQTSAVFTVRSDAMRGPAATPTQIGEYITEHTFTTAGQKFKTTTRFGRLLAFDAGTTAITRGTTVTGGTSGATGIVRSIPDRLATGTWAGGNRAGNMFLSDVTGTWQDNEAIQVAGVTRATVNGTLGIAIGEQNSYGILCNFTSVKYLKVKGYPAQEVGLYTGQMTGSKEIVPTGSPPADTVQGYHPNNPNVIRELYIPSNAPRTPPGDYSLCTTTKMFGDDRVGGNRKVIVNSCSGTTGIDPGGEFVSEYYVRYRYGNLV